MAGRFQNALFATGPDGEFTASYTRWGDLLRVIARIEYVDPDRSTGITAFDMCAVINR